MFVATNNRDWILVISQKSKVQSLLTIDYLTNYLDFKSAIAPLVIAAMALSVALGK